MRVAVTAVSELFEEYSGCTDSLTDGECEVVGADEFASVACTYSDHRLNPWSYRYY